MANAKSEKTAEMFVPQTNFVSNAALDAIARGEAVTTAFLPQTQEDQKTVRVCAGNGRPSDIPVGEQVTVTLDEAAVIDNMLYYRKSLSGR